jgi:hypothetical protein
VEESFAVGVAVELKGNAAQTIDTLIEAMNKLDSAANAARETFTNVSASVRALGRAGTSIDKLIAAMDKLRSAPELGPAVEGMDQMARAADAMLRASSELSMVMRENAKLADETAKAMREAAAAAGRTGGRSGGGPGGGPGGRGGKGGVNHEDYLMAGIGASLAGAPMVGVVDSALGRAIEVAHLRQQILADQRVSQAQADEAVQRAYAVTNAAPGTRVHENLSALIDLKNITGSMSEAEQMLPQFAQMSAMLQVMDRKRGGAGDPAFAAAKAMEIMGAMTDEKTNAQGQTVREINPALLQQRLNEMTRVAVATNMRVDPGVYLGFAKQARVAGMTLTDEFIYEKLPALLGVLGGQRTGTALMSLAQVTRGGRMQASTYANLVQAGLADPNAHKEERYRDDKGRLRTREIVSPGGIYDSDLLAKDPLEWMQAAQKRMEAQGIHGTENQINTLMQGSQRATIAGLLADLLKDMPTILKEQENIKNTNPNVAMQIAQNDPAAKLQQFEAAWDKLLTSFGSAALDDAMKALDRVTSTMNALGDWAQKNPDIAGPITKFVGAAGALLLALGAISTAIFFTAPALRLLGLAINPLTGAWGAAAAQAGLAAAESEVAAAGPGAASAVLSVGGALRALVPIIGAIMLNQYLGKPPLAALPADKKGSVWWDPEAFWNMVKGRGGTPSPGFTPTIPTGKPLLLDPGGAAHPAASQPTVPVQARAPTQVTPPTRGPDFTGPGPEDMGRVDFSVTVTDRDGASRKVEAANDLRTTGSLAGLQEKFPPNPAASGLQEKFPPRPFHRDAPPDLIGTMTPAMREAAAERALDQVIPPRPFSRLTPEEQMLNQVIPPRPFHRDAPGALHEATPGEIKVMLSHMTDALKAAFGEQHISVTSIANLDSREISRKVVELLAKQAYGPPTSSTGFNAAKSPLPTGAIPAL